MKKVKRNAGMFTKETAKKFGSKGGTSTFKKLGSKGMAKLVNKRWEKFSTGDGVSITTSGDTIKEYCPL